VSQSLRLHSVAEALTPLMARAGAVRPIVMKVEAALGCVAAESVRATTPVPVGAIAMRPGYAVTAAETIGASSYSPLPLKTTVGRLRVGDSLPAGADAVVPSDAVTIVEGSTAELMQEAYAGENARLPGQDLPAGALIVPAGATVTAEHALALALAGVDEIAIARPRVRILVKGRSGPSLMWLRTFLDRLGCACETGDAGDAASGQDDLVVSLAGGEDDAWRRMIGGATWSVAGLALRPGDSAAAGLMESGPPLIALPLRFDGAMAAALALILPVVARLQSRRLSLESRRLARKIASAIGFTDLVLLDHVDDMFAPMTTGDITLDSLVRARAFLFAPPASEGFAEGALVSAVPLARPLASDAG